MARIHSLRAQSILDSRGNPTIEVTLATSQAEVSATVPSGASVGVHEALELRDDDGKGVSKAIAHLQEIVAPALIGEDLDQQQLDARLCELDGTPNKSRLGANATLGVSIAFARAEAKERNVPLYAYLGSLDNRTTFSVPEPLFNVLNGGKHARHGIDIQECMLAPTGFSSIRERVVVVKKCLSALKSLLEKNGYDTQMGDEGGFAPALRSNDEGLDLLVEAISQAGYTTDQIQIALDVAASSLYKDGRYLLRAGGVDQSLDGEQMSVWYTALANTYPLISIEDGFAEDDFDGFAALTKNLGGALCIVGDDLTVTNVERIQTAVDKKAVNACIIKPNQIGTVTETVEAVRAARSAGWKVFASHRSGETMDTFIADFAVGLSCDYLKAGAPTREERSIKYNRLMEIEDELHAL
ncbi:MAG: phosphopyruvate hydratase [Minisyncoccia bacterium]